MKRARRGCPQTPTQSPAKLFPWWPDARADTGRLNYSLHRFALSPNIANPLMLGCANFNISDHVHPTRPDRFFLTPAIAPFAPPPVIHQCTLERFAHNVPRIVSTNGVSELPKVSGSECPRWCPSAEPSNTINGGGKKAYVSGKSLQVR